MVGAADVEFVVLVLDVADGAVSRRTVFFDLDTVVLLSIEGVVVEVVDRMAIVVEVDDELEVRLSGWICFFLSL